MELNENWTVYIVGQMHRYRITSACLASKLDWTPAYLSTILNGKRSATGKTKIKIFTALRNLIKEKEEQNDGN